MRMRSAGLLLVFFQVLLPLPPASAQAQEAHRPPAEAGAEAAAVRPDLQLIYLFDGEKPEYLFVLGQSGFRTVEALQRHLETWPPGSELRWAPGCLRLGGEPLLSSDEEMEAFRAFLEKRGIRLVLVPSG